MYGNNFGQFVHWGKSLPRETFGKKNVSFQQKIRHLEDQL